MNEATWPRTLEAWGVAWAEHTGLPSRWVLFVVVLATGFLAAIVARSLARQLTLRGGRLVARFGPVSVQADFEHLAGVIGRAAFWLILLLTVMVGTEMLGLSVVTVWLSQLASYVPRAVAAVFIAALGILAARVARKVVVGAARSARVPAFERIGRTVEVAILIGAGLVAVEQLGIDVSLLTTLILIVLSALFGGAALAFGLGGRDWVANVLSAHYVSRLYQVGQTIRVSDVEGRIVRITETVVILETADGEVAVPAGTFSSGPSTLILRGHRRQDVQP